MHNWTHYLITKNEDILDQTLRENKDIIKKINQHNKILDEIDVVLHKTPDWIDPCFDLLLYCNLEIEASTFLAMNGYYEDAVALLRIILETSFKKIYTEDIPFIEDMYYEIFEDLMEKKEKLRKERKWNKESENQIKRELRILHPTFKDTVEYLFQWASVKNFESLRKNKPSFKNEIMALYKSLCSYIHPSKDRAIYAGWDVKTSSFYLKQEFQIWSEYYFNTLKILSILFKAK